MVRLYQLAILAFLASGATGNLFGAENYCSLSVAVSSPNGRRPLVFVKVQEPDGRIHEVQQNGGAARFCDLGISPVTVTVGEVGCNQVVVRDVPLYWLRTYNLKVTYDIEPCLVDTVKLPVPVCRLLFRVQDELGQWVKGASITFDNKEINPITTDDAGRALLVVKSGSDVRASVNASGFPSVIVNTTCSSAESDHEQSVKLLPSRQR